jgi:hypothetical protein
MNDVDTDEAPADARRSEGKTPEPRLATSPPDRVFTPYRLGGYYLVETDDLPDLLQLLGIISDGEPVEVRPTVTETEDLGAATSDLGAADRATPGPAPQEAAR